MPTELNTEQHQQRAAALFATLLPQHRIVAISRCAGGYSHDNYRIDCSNGSYALRIPNSALRGSVVETRWLTDWATHLAPSLLAWRNDGLMLTRWCESPALTRQRPTLTCCRALLDAIAAIPVTPAMPDHALQSRVTADFDIGGASQALRHALTITPDLPPARSVCHNDLNPDNLLLSDGAWCVLDWEWAGLNWPLFDAAALYRGLANPDFSFAELTPHASDTERQLALRWFALREVGFAIAAIARGNRHPALIEQRDRYSAELIK